MSCSEAKRVIILRRLLGFRFWTAVGFYLGEISAGPRLKPHPDNKKKLMRGENLMKVFRMLGFVLLALACCSIAIAQEPFTAGTWTRVTPSSTPIAAGHPQLLTDGSVLILSNTCNATG